MKLWMRYAVLCGLWCAVIPVYALPLEKGYHAVANVNDVSVTPYDIEKRIILLRYVNNIPDSVTLTPQDKNAILRTIVDEIVKAQEVARFKAEASEDRLQTYLSNIAQNKGKNLKQFLAELQAKGLERSEVEKIFARQISWQDFMQGRYGRDISVSSYEVSQILQASSAFQNVMVKTKSITLPFEGESDFQKKRLEAEKILSRIREGQEFDSFKGTYAIDVDKTLLPVASFDKNLHRFLLDAAAGDISGLMRTEKGLQIVTIMQKDVNSQKAFSYENAPQAMKEEVLRKVKQHKLELKEKEYLRTLRNQAVIHIYE